jgi:superfamily II DNA helicase RecQ
LICLINSNIGSVNTLDNCEGETIQGVFIPNLSTYSEIAWTNDIIDCTSRFHGTNYPHSSLMLTAFREQFGLRSFRPQQFEAVNAAMLRNNCFILMPTGGGKSLCYQLPATLASEGHVTFVVSPLKSLIIDQVNKLEALGIHTAHLLGIGDGEDEITSNNAKGFLNLNFLNKYSLLILQCN